jgi:type I restriction enzyme S subunit
MKWGKTLSLPKGWEIKKLEEVCDFKSGTTISPSLEREVGDVLYLKVGDMNLPENEIEINTSSRFVNRNEIKQVQIIPEGAVIFPKRGGAIATNKRKVIQPTIVDLNTMAIIPTNKLDSDYFYYWFQMIDLNDISNGTSIPQINNYSFDDIYIQYPKSLSEQQRIVSILDECFAAINKAKANAEQNLKNAKELFESYLQGVFEKKGDGWEEKRFDEVCVLQRGFDLPTHSRFEGEYPLVSSNGITDSINQWKVKAPGVVTGRSGTIGNVHFIEEDFWPLNTALYIKDFYGNDERFIYYFLTAFDLSKYSSGAGVPTLNRNNVHIVKVSIPKSKEEQQTIVRQLDALRAETQKLEAVYQKKLDDLEELKKSILQKAFAGELKTEKAVAV